MDHSHHILNPLPERAWLGVVSAEHAAIGAAHGWIQLNHGKRNNLARLHLGDGFAFYSPTQRFGEKTPLRAITQIGIVADEEPYLAEEAQNMGARGTFRGAPPLEARGRKDGLSQAQENVRQRSLADLRPGRFRAAPRLCGP